MTRRSGRLQRRSENALEQKGKQSNRKKTQPLSKLQCEKNQLVGEGLAKPSVVIETTEKRVGDSFAVLTSRNSTSRPVTSPHPRCGSSEGVWTKMMVKEQTYQHSKSFIQKHPRLQPRMRSILLDWLIEVSEEYALHRQTFYLAQDYFDRFMLTQNDIDKSLLQLIGITCLFIASKMEETCPPKLSQMVYIAADTYFEHEILQMELMVLKALRWNLCPETAVSWLKLFFQMASVSCHTDLLEQQFPRDAYVEMTQLLDLCILNINSLDFQYRVLAASVLSHFIHQETVEKVSGLSSDDIQPCLNWMAPFVDTLGQLGRGPQKDLTNVKADDRHNIQTHADNLSMLDACDKKVTGQFPTPPNSSEKSGAH
ncbi:G1/S-specific cyclin-E2-like [Aulostomus maculatus]